MRRMGKLFAASYAVNKGHIHRKCSHRVHGVALEAPAPLPMAPCTAHAVAMLRLAIQPAFLTPTHPCRSRPAMRSPSRTFRLISVRLIAPAISSIACTA